MILKAFARRLAATLLLGLLVLTPAGATVNSTASKTIVLGNGITTNFSFSFVGVAAAYISVILTDASGNETVLTQGSGTTQYTITLNPPVTGAIWGLGGSIVYNPSGTPIPSGSTLTIFRTLPLTQAISLQNQNSLARLGNGAETGLDLGVMQTQQQVEVLNRAIVAPIVDATAPAPLPPIAQRANQGAAFDALGNLVAGQTPSGGIISSAMQPVVNAATLAAGRTALGLGAMATENIGAGLADDGAGSARVVSPIVSVATNQAVNASYHLKRYRTTGPINFTLPRVNTLFNGFGFWIENNGAGAIALVIDANDRVQGYSSGVAVSIPTNVVVFVTTDAANTGTILLDFGTGTQTPVVQTLGGLTLSTAGSTGVFSVASGVASDRNYGGLMRLTAAFTKSTTAWSVGSGGAGALDFGAIAANTWYHVFVIGRPAQATTDVLISLSATAPTLPANYTLFRRIGSMKTNGSSWWTTFTQFGDDFLWMAPPHDIATATLTAIPTPFTLSVPTGVQVFAEITGLFSNAANGTQLLIQSPDVTGAGPANGLVTARVQTAAIANAFVTDVRTDTNAQLIAYASAASSSLDVSTKGWRDPRGK